MLGLKDKVIVVSGGNRGIGAAIVALLEDHGARVAYTYRTTPGPRGALALQGDVTDKAGMEALLDQVEDELGPIYGAVANAAIHTDNLFHTLSEDQWRSVFETNVFGAVNFMAPVTRRLAERREGAMVFIGSVVAARGNFGQSNYSATKGAIHAMAKSMARELASKQVRVNVVAPGFIDTDMVKGLDDPIREKLTREIPMRRFGQPEDVAWAAAYLLSPVASAYVTGEVLQVNGALIT
jgi:acetoacetyl-CoA reductase